MFLLKVRSKVRCIGTTTLYKYRKYIEKDPIYKEFFQEILVKEPSIDHCISILRSIKGHYESHFVGTTFLFRIFF